MTTRLNAAATAKQIVPKPEEIRRKHDGTWNPATMVSATTAEGAALLAAMAKANEPMPAPVKSEIFIGPPSNAQGPQPRLEASISADRESVRTTTKAQAAIAVKDAPIEKQVTSTQPAQGLPAVDAPVIAIEQDTTEPGAEALLRMLAPEGPWAVRSISSINGGAPKSPRGLGYDVGPHNAADLENGLHGWIGAAEARKLNCYLHAAIGPNDKPKLSRNDVIGARAVWTDVDPGDEKSPITSEADFVERRAKILAAMRMEDPPFSCIVDSGNGYQAYKFIQPYRIDGESDRLTALEAANKAVNASINERLAGTGLKADKCYSADHLMRLAGTTNFLTAKKRSHGYPDGDRPARIVDWHPERIYRL